MKTTYFQLRLSEKELASWREKAAEEGVTVSVWVRKMCNTRAATGHTTIKDALAGLEKRRRDG